MPLVDLEGLDILKSNSVILSQLQEKSNKLTKDDYFVVDEEKYGNYQTRKISYDDLSVNIQNEMLNSPANLSGEWFFNKGNKLTLDTRKILEEKGDQNGLLAVNLDYQHNVVEKTIYDLSSKLYSENAIIPSFVGQIVTSNTLSTLYVMRQRYGENTTWVTIQGRMLLGEGKADDNDYLKFGEMPESRPSYNVSATGGDFSVLLTAKNIPKHTHRFKADTQRFTLSWYLSWINEELPEGEKHSSGVQFYSASFIEKKANKGSTYVGGVWEVKAKQLETMSATFTGESEISTTKFPCKGNMSSAVYATTTGAGGKPVSSKCLHNNVPPFRTKYIWRRIA